MKKTLFFLSLMLVFISFTQAQDNDYNKAVKKMFSVSGAMKQFDAAIDNMLNIYAQQGMDINSLFWSEFRAELDSTSVDMLVDMLVPVYQNHLTLQELEGVIEFYQSPIGKRYAEKSPLITSESMQIGAEWGRVMGERIAVKLNEFQNQDSNTDKAEESKPEEKAKEEKRSKKNK